MRVEKEQAAAHVTLQSRVKALLLVTSRSTQHPKRIWDWLSCRRYSRRVLVTGKVFFRSGHAFKMGGETYKALDLVLLASDAGKQPVPQNLVTSGDKDLNSIGAGHWWTI